MASIGGGLNSFLENFAGTDRGVPKLALYRLWLGSSPASMKCLTKAVGDGAWGQLHDCYFLAEGNKERLNRVFSDCEKEYGKPIMGEKGERLKPISDVPLDRKIVAALSDLPRAPGSNNR